MISKGQVKFLNALHQKKFRKEHRLFIAEGEKVCRDLFDAGWEIEMLFMTEDFRKEKYSRRNETVRPEMVTSKDLEKISSLTTPQEVIAVVRIPEREFPPEELEHELTLMLDGIKDPGNLGTIIRIADWFGIKNIVCSETSADVYNSKTVQATMGSLFRVNVYYEQLPDLLKQASGKNISVYGTFPDGENIYESELSSSGIILIGSESHGISDELTKLISRRISIPSFSNGKKGKADSLNAAMAAAIVCSEFRRRK